MRILLVCLILKLAVCDISLKKVKEMLSSKNQLSNLDTKMRGLSVKLMKGVSFFNTDNKTDL